MFANNSRHRILGKRHNCMIGSEDVNVQIWAERYSQSTALPQRPKLWHAVNKDRNLLIEVLQVRACPLSTRCPMSLMPTTMHLRPARPAGSGLQPCDHWC